MWEQRRRRGFTLRELLVAVTLLCFCLALAVPALQASRAAARRNQCGYHLKEINLGLLNYHDTFKVFPMGAMHAGLHPGGDPPINARLGPSWWYATLAFTIQNSIYDGIQNLQRSGGPANNRFCAQDVIAAGIVWRDTRGTATGPFGRPIEYMRCPSSPLPAAETATGPICLPSYVGISGGCDIDPDSDDYRIGSGLSAQIVLTSAEDLYRNQAKGTGAAAGGIVTSSGMLPPCQHVRLADCLDGTSNTMIVAEQSDWLLDQNPASSQKYHGDPGWSVGGTAAGGGWLSGTARADPVPEVAMPGGPPAGWGADCWNITTVRYPPNRKRVMGGTPWPGCSENHGINNPLQSAHAGGLLIANVDGSVHFISQTTDLSVLLRLAIRNDGQPLRVTSPSPSGPIAEGTRGKAERCRHSGLLASR